MINNCTFKSFFINYLKDNIVFPAWTVFNSDIETSVYYKIKIEKIRY